MLTDTPSRTRSQPTLSTQLIHNRGIQHFIFSGVIKQLEDTANAYLSVLAEGGTDRQQNTPFNHFIPAPFYPLTYPLISPLIDVLHYPLTYPLFFF